MMYTVYYNYKPNGRLFEVRCKTLKELIKLLVKLDEKGTGFMEIVDWNKGGHAGME